MLHGDFSIGPGQKYTDNRYFDETSTSSQYSDSECAAAEAIKFSFGSGSYARRILESMGWNDVSPNILIDICFNIFFNGIFHSFVGNVNWANNSMLILIECSSTVSSCVYCPPKPRFKLLNGVYNLKSSLI